MNELKRKGVNTMDEDNNIVELHEDTNGQLDLFEEQPPEPSNTDDSLKQAIEEQLKKIQRQNLLLGAQTACSVVLQKIIAVQNKSGKITMNDYKRLVKDIQKFCEVGVSRKVNADGETEPINNNTKLMEETNDQN